MYSLNIKLHQDYKSYVIRLEGGDGESELDKLYTRNPEHIVHVQISKAKDSKTLAQMRALRALISAFFFCGASSCPDDVKDLDSFVIWIKLQLDYYVDMEVHGQKIRVVKSFADASKERMTDLIESLLKLLDLSGATNDEKVQEIIAGMKSNELY